MTRRAFASLATCAIILVSAAWAQDPNRSGQADQPRTGQQPGMQGQQQTGQGQQMGQQGQQQRQGEAGAMTAPSSWYKAKDLIDKNVRDSNDADLGKVEDLIMLPHNGAVPFAIISGSRIDRSGENVALPWSVLRFEPGARDVMLTVTKDALHNAQLAGFETNQWPDFAAPTFVERVYREFGQSPPSYELPPRMAGHAEGAPGEEKAAGAEHWFRISTLRDDEIRDSNNEKIGDVDNVIIDLKNGHVLFVTLAGRHVDRRDEYIAIPWSALRIAGSGDRTHLVLNMNKNDLKNAPAFSEDNWNNITSPNFLQNTFSFYRATPYWEGGKTQQAGYTEPGQQQQQPRDQQRPREQGGPGQQPRDSGGGQQPSGGGGQRP